MKALKARQFFEDVRKLHSPDAPAVNCSMQRFSSSDKSLIAHALDHLLANKIAEDGHSGWYSGNREQFLGRHKKSIALLQGFLSPNSVSPPDSK
jgi:hypothetical protein